MRIERGWWIFRSIEILLEGIDPSDLQMLLRRYGRIVVLSHHPLQLPGSFRRHEKLTPNIYLIDSIETIFGRFRDTVRNEIKRTERSTDFFVRVPCAMTADIYRMYTQFEYAQNRTPFSGSYLRHFQYACAFDKGRPISAVAFYRSADVLRIFAIFSLRLAARDEQDRELYKTIGYATKRIIFEICVWGKTQGAVLLDLASVNHTDPSKASIARFKEGFGGRIEHEYQYVYENRFFTLLHALGKWKATCLAMIHSSGRSCMRVCRDKIKRFV